METPPLVALIEGNERYGSNLNQDRDSLTFVLRRCYHCEVRVIESWSAVEYDHPEIISNLKQEGQNGRLIMILVGIDQSYELTNIRQSLGEFIPVFVLKSVFCDGPDLNELGSDTVVCNHDDEALQGEILRLTSVYLEGKIIGPATVIIGEDYFLESKRLNSMSSAEKKALVYPLLNHSSSGYGDNVKGFAIDALTMERQITGDYGLHQYCIEALWRRLENIAFYYPITRPFLGINEKESRGDWRFQFQGRILFGLIFGDTQFQYPVLLFYPEGQEDDEFRSVVEKIRVEGEYLVLPITDCLGR